MSILASQGGYINKADNLPFSPASASRKTHYTTSDDPNERREDDILNLKTMRIISVLRTSDALTPSTLFA